MLEQMHESFLACQFVQGQLWATPKFLKAIDKVFVCMHSISQEQWKNKIAFLRAAVYEL